jgi:hypothetical protein
MTSVATIFVCGLDDPEFDWGHCMGLAVAQEQEAEQAEAEREWDLDCAASTHLDEPDFYEEREATDPYWPPAECVWWEVMEPQVISLVAE